MIYESQVRRSQVRAGTTENSEPTALAAALQPLENTLQRGADFARANPLVAVASVAAVGALLVMAAKSKSRSDDTAVVKIRRDLNRFISSQRSEGAGLGDAVSSLTRAFTSEPETMAAVRKAMERGIAKASDTIKSATR